MAATPTSTTTTTVRPAPRGRRRGRETALDMIRSLGIVMLIVVPLWFLAQPNSGDAKKFRVVDPTADVTAFRRAAPGVPAPTTPPSGWRATSSTLDPGALRIGWVVPGNTYAEYAASTAAAATFLPTITGEAQQIGTVDVGGVTWRELRDTGGHTSFVREVAGGTVVVGGERETATPEQLRLLAGTVR
jgi:hypothetical protein